MRRSAGLLLHREGPGGVEVLLGHMGGPLWVGRDAEAWTIPKGEHGDDESPLAAACREFSEELGLPAPDVSGAVALGEVRQSRKVVTAFAVQHDLDPASVVPGEFEMTWPPRSGRVQRFPELDRVAWLDPGAATAALVVAQRAFVGRLLVHLTPSTY